MPRAPPTNCSPNDSASTSLRPRAEELSNFDIAVKRTGGIPILLELAAATFDPDEVATGPSPTADYSVGAAIDDALALVEPGAIDLLEVLAVMPSALNIETVSAYVADDTLTRRFLHQLRGVRLIVAETGPAGRRYRVLDPIADEIAARLGDSRTDSIMVAMDRNLGDRFRAFRPVESGPLHPELLAGLDDEHESLHAVIEHHLQHGRGAAALRLVANASWYLWHRSLVDVTQEQVERAFAIGDADLATRASGLCALADVLGDSFRVAACLEEFERVLAEAGSGDLDNRLLGKLIMWTALSRGLRGDLDGTDELIDRASGVVAPDPWLRAQLAQLRAYRLAGSGELEAACEGLRRCSHDFERLGDQGDAATSHYLAAVIGDLVDAPSVMTDIEESRRLASAFGSERMLTRLDFLEASFRSRALTDATGTDELLEIGDRLERSGSLRMAALVRRNAALTLLPTDPERGPRCCSLPWIDCSRTTPPPRLSGWPESPPSSATRPCGRHSWRPPDAGGKTRWYRSPPRTSAPGTDSTFLPPPTRPALSTSTRFAARCVPCPHSSPSSSRSDRSGLG